LIWLKRPDGYRSITPYLVVNDAAAAIDFYKRSFDAKETYRHPTPDGKIIVNAELKMGDSVVLLSDEFPHGGCRSPDSIGGRPLHYIFTPRMLIKSLIGP
jgi:PhnB protein